MPPSPPNIDCTPTATEIFVSQASLTTPIGMEATLHDTGTKWRARVASGNYAAKATYTFEIRATYPGNFYKWHSAG